MTALPAFTHHELLLLAEPFARRGLRVDLAASDREARRLVFQAREHAAEAGLPAQREVMVIEQRAAQAYTLSRILRVEVAGAAPAETLQAELSVEGADPQDLLERLEAVPHSRQLLCGPGYLAVLQQRLPARAPGSAAASAVAIAQASALSPPVVLREAHARVAGLALRMRVSGVSGYPAELELQRPEGEAITLPADLLEVLGRGWERLTVLNRGWLGSVRLKGAEPRRSLEACAHLERLLAHLALTLAEPPARFHQRHRRARWAVAMRGTLPIAVGLGLVGTALWFQRQAPPGYQSVLALLANIAPPLLMGAMFLRREMPRISLPRVPIRPGPQAWRPRALHVPPAPPAP